MTPVRVSEPFRAHDTSLQVGMGVRACARCECVRVCMHTYVSQEAQHHLGPGCAPQGHVGTKSGWIPIPPPDNPIELYVMVPSPIYSESSHSHHPEPIPPSSPSLFNLRTFPPNKCWARRGKLDAVVLSLRAYLDGSMLV